MDRRRRDSSAASKALLSRQLASITDTLAKASQRRDEEVKRARRPSRASTATTNPASPRKPTAAARRMESRQGQQTPVSVYLRGGGDEESRGPYHASRLDQWERAEDVRQERKEFEKMVKGKGPDGPEREKMIECLLARSKLAKMNTKKEVIRADLEAEEEKVGEDERMVIREREVDNFEELVLKEEVDMELEDLEAGLKQWEEERRETLRVRAKDWARSIRSEFLTQTNHAALFKDPEAEKTEQARLEEELFAHLVAQMEAQDAKDLEVTTTLRGSDEAVDGKKMFKPVESPGDSAMALWSDELDNEHSIPAIPQLRGGEEDDQDAGHHQRSQATSSKPEAAQQAATSLAVTAAAAAAAAAAAEAARKRRLQEEYDEMKYRVEACDIEREARVEVAQRRLLRDKAGRLSGLASDEAFEHMKAFQEAEERELVEMLKRQRLEACSSDPDDTEEAVLNKSAREELRRRKSQPEAERSYLLPPASPPKRSPPPYIASELELEDVGDNASHPDAVMRGGHATPLHNGPGALLAELASLRETIHLPEERLNDTVYDGDELRQMLTDLDRSTLLAELASIRETSHLPEIEINSTVHGGDNVRQMLAELDRSARSTHATTTDSNDPRATFEDLPTLSAPGPQELQSPTSEDFEEDDDEDISALRARLERLTSSTRSVTPAPAPVGLIEGRDETAIPGDLPSEAIPHVVALELELSGCEWAVARGWTRCLFSSSLNSYEAQKEKGIAVIRAEEALQKTIASVMKVEEENRQKDEGTKLQRRLIVSNLAAGADAEEMERQFWQYRSDIVNITMLPDRDPLKRTQTAHVDFSSRKLAVQASFISGQVYGLIFDVKLSVPVE